MHAEHVKTLMLMQGLAKLLFMIIVVSVGKVTLYGSIVVSINLAIFVLCINKNTYTSKNTSNSDTI